MTKKATTKKKAEKILKDLNENQKEFCREYTTDWNITRAYAKVYGVKDTVASVNGHRLLGNAKINEYIEWCKAHLEEVSGISRQRVLMEFVKIAFSNMADFNESWVSRKEFNKLTEEEKACICEIKNETIKGDNWEKETIKIRLYDKQKALENINKMMGYNVPEEQNINIIAQITGMKIT